MLTLGQRIKAKRKEKKLTQIEVAKRLGIDNTTVSKWESDVYEPDAEALVKLAELFDTTSDYLLGRTDDPTPPGNSKPREEFEDPELGLWFKELLDAPEERREELRKIWEIIKQREAGRKPGDKQGE